MASLVTSPAAPDPRDPNRALDNLLRQRQALEEALVRVAAEGRRLASDLADNRDRRDRLAQELRRCDLAILTFYSKHDPNWVSRFVVQQFEAFTARDRLEAELARLRRELGAAHKALRARDAEAVPLGADARCTRQPDGTYLAVVGGRSFVLPPALGALFDYLVNRQPGAQDPAPGGKRTVAEACAALGPARGQPLASHTLDVRVARLRAALAREKACPGCLILAGGFVRFVLRAHPASRRPRGSAPPK